MPRYEGRDKTARFIQFAARFIVGLLARVCCLQVNVRSTFLSNAKNFQDLYCREKVVQPYSRFSRKLDHELVDCTKKHQFPLQTSINNNKPFASTGSWFPTFSLKQISSIEVSLICSICHIYSHLLPMVLPCFPMVSPCFPMVSPWFPMFSSPGCAEDQGTGRCRDPRPRGNAEALGRHDVGTKNLPFGQPLWQQCEIHPLW